MKHWQSILNLIMKPGSSVVTTGRLSKKIVSLGMPIVTEASFCALIPFDGRREFVLVDTDGPGAITRFWVTVAAYSDKGTLRFYLDNQEVPEIEGEVLGILSGHALVDAPLSASVSELTDYKQRGHNLYLPYLMPSIARLPMKVLPSRNPASFPKNASITTSITVLMQKERL